MARRTVKEVEDTTQRLLAAYREHMRSFEYEQAKALHLQINAIAWTQGKETQLTVELDYV